VSVGKIFHFHAQKASPCGDVSRSSLCRAILFVQFEKKTSIRDCQVDVLQLIVCADAKVSEKEAERNPAEGIRSANRQTFLVSASTIWLMEAIWTVNSSRHWGKVRREMYRNTSARGSCRGCCCNKKNFSALMSSNCFGPAIKRELKTAGKLALECIIQFAI
jgi:hypothetical protein